MLNLKHYQAQQEGDVEHIVHTKRHAYTCHLEHKDTTIHAWTKKIHRLLGEKKKKKTTTKALSLYFFFMLLFPGINRLR